MTAGWGTQAERDRALRWTGLGACLLVGLTLVAFALVWGSRGPLLASVGPRLGVMSFAAILLTGLVYGAVAAFLIRHSPRDPIGWLFLLVGAGMALLLTVNVVLESTVHAFRSVSSEQLWMTWALSSVQLPVSGAAVIVAILLFPTGRTTWRHARLTIWLAFVGAALLALAAMSRPDGLLWSSTLPNPAAAPQELKPLLRLVSLAGIVFLVIALGAAVASLVWRFRHGDIRQRRQLAWVMAGSVGMACAVAVLFAARYLGVTSPQQTDALVLIGGIGASLLPISMVRFTTVTASLGTALGDVTFLFTDLQDSTAMYERVGDITAFDLVRLHFDTLESATRRHGGAIVKTIGDAIMARFYEPAQAVSTAIEMFERLDAINRQADTRLVLKVGLHRGPAIVVPAKGGPDYFGQTVNVAARVGAVAGAGEIVITDEVFDDPAVAGLLEGRQLVAESVALKGVAAVVPVHRLAAMASLGQTVPGAAASPVSRGL